MKVGDLITPLEDLFITFANNEYSACSPGQIGIITEVGAWSGDGFIFVVFNDASGWVLDDEVRLLTQS